MVQLLLARSEHSKSIHTILPFLEQYLGNTSFFGNLTFLESPAVDAAGLRVHVRERDGEYDRELNIWR